MAETEPREILLLDYTNWKDVRRWRTVWPVRIWFGSTEWHPEEQWLMEALDMEDEDRPTRDFAMSDIHEMRPGQGQPLRYEDWKARAEHAGVEGSKLVRRHLLKGAAAIFGMFPSLETFSFTRMTDSEGGYYGMSPRLNGLYPWEDRMAWKDDAAKAVESLFSSVRDCDMEEEFGGDRKFVFGRDGSFLLEQGRFE